MNLQIVIEDEDEKKRTLTPYKRKTEMVLQAEAILKRVKCSLQTKMYRYLCALDAFAFVPVQEQTGCCTDGTHIYYNPKMVIRREKYSGIRYLEYDIAHIVAHGLLGHFETTKEFRNKELLWVIMDAQVKMFLEKIGICRYEKNQDLFGKPDDLQESEVTNGFSSYYKALQSKTERKKWEKRGYYSDDHRFWKQPDNRKWIAIRNMILGERADNLPADQYMRAMLEVDGGTQASRGYGNNAGHTKQTVRVAAESHMSYRELLMYLVMEQEAVKELPDTLDAMLYSYGLELYGDVPLVEPSEVNEIRQLHSLVVAIDTSGSCGGDIAGTFLQETYRLLLDLRDVARFESVYLLQCDTEIQDEKCFTCVDELCDMQEQELYGFGGTSFVPVFRRIEELQENDAVTVDALLYLTDTMGQFPDKKPDYPVYLIIPEEETTSDGRPVNQDIPDWTDYIVIGKQKEWL